MISLIQKINPFLLSLSSMAIVVSYIPQLIKTFKSRSSKGQSLMFWVLLCISVFGFVNNGVVVYLNGGGLGTLIPQLFNFVFAFAMLVMVIVFPDK